jgi:hypothetical protein
LPGHPNTSPSSVRTRCSSGSWTAVSPGCSSLPAVHRFHAWKPKTIMDDVYLVLISKVAYLPFLWHYSFHGNYKLLNLLKEANALSVSRHRLSLRTLIPLSVTEVVDLMIKNKDISSGNMLNRWYKISSKRKLWLMFHTKKWSWETYGK